MLKTTVDIINWLSSNAQFSTQDLLIILGPTASGKTKLAVELANALHAEIISADSRQVYKGMDIGTGKDLGEYAGIPYHLIDILQPGEKYNIAQFLADFEEAYLDIRSRGKKVIVCGGTGFYIASLLAEKPYTQIPVDAKWRQELELLPKQAIRAILESHIIPPEFTVDFSSKKRMIRAIEIIQWLANNPDAILKDQPIYSAFVIGLNPDLETRRNRISNRLQERLKMGMIEEIENLVRSGISFEELEYYGLEYKYTSYYLQGKMSYEQFVTKLETEIHRYAKRQMTFFRKMEKDGIKINWL